MLESSSSSSPETLQPLINCHNEAVAAIEARRCRRYDDLISHVLNLQDSGEAEMDDLELLTLFLGL